MDDISGGAGASEAHGGSVIGYWLAIVFLTGALGLVSGMAVGVQSGANTAEEQIAASCDQSGAFTVKRRGFVCDRKGKD